MLCPCAGRDGVKVARKPWRDLRVLVLDDEPLLLLDVQEILQGLSVTSVTACSSIEAATEEAKTNTFDVAILDVVVGDGTSTDLALLLHKQQVAIGFLSGAEAEALPEVLRSCPMLHKPYTPATLAAFLERLAPRG